MLEANVSVGSGPGAVLQRRVGTANERAKNLERLPAPFADRAALVAPGLLSLLYGQEAGPGVEPAERRRLSTSCRNRLFFASSSSASSCWPTQLALLPRLSALLRASLAAARGAARVVPVRHVHRDRPLRYRRGHAGGSPSAQLEPELLALVPRQPAWHRLLVHRDLPPLEPGCSVRLLGYLICTGTGFRLRRKGSA